MEEDTYLRTNETIHQLFDLNESVGIEVEGPTDLDWGAFEDGYLNFTPHENFVGSFTVNLTFNDNGTITKDEIHVNVTNVNDEPVIDQILVNGDPNELINPVVAHVQFADIDDDEVEITWYLDGEEIGKGENLQRYIYPDQNNLTVVIDDGNGGSETRTIVIHTIPPEGWGEEANNTINRVIFWTIFGSAGAILIAAMVWVLFKPESRVRNKGEDRQK
jgi:hypothetical protein